MWNKTTSELSSIGDMQYQILAARRQAYDQMLWQTPIISLTGQAFIFTVALGNGDGISREIACFLAFTMSFASAHLLAKHRRFEVVYSKLLQRIEEARGLPGIHDQPPSGGGVTGLSAYNIWLHLFCFVFPMAAAAAFYLAWRG